VRKLVSVP